MERRGGDLSERKKLILRAIIDAYISGGEPVGSKYLTQSGQIAFSSATIRNEMAELEEMVISDSRIHRQDVFRRKEDTDSMLTVLWTVTA